jgi:glycosyltransferase involved in cell wall biosynthesis
MCHAFQQIGIDVVLAIPAGSGNMSRSQMYRTIQQKLGKTPTFKIRCLSNFTVAGRLEVIGTYFGIRSLFRDYADVDFCFARSSIIAHLAVSQCIRTIYESHGVVINARYKLLDRIYRRYLLRDAQSPNLVLFIAISHALAKIWKRMGIPARKMLTLHDGFSAEDYKSVTSREEARRLLGIKTGSKIVLYAGSLYEDRGIENILRLARVFPNVGFYVIGGPEKNKQLYEVISAKEGLKNVFFPGSVLHREVKDYLFAADVLLMLYTDNVPTIEICSPLKAFEYMAAGRIIVGQAFPTIEEVLSDDRNALLADPNSYEDLEKKLSQALQYDYPNSLADNARHLAFKKYSWDKRARHILDALEKNTEI